MTTRRAFWVLLGPRWRSLTVLGIVSIAVGVLEAAFLVAVTRIAFAVADGAETVQVTRGLSANSGASIAIGLGLVLVRMAATTLQVWLAARLAASVVAKVRDDLSRAFLRADWATQQQSSAGRLQELLTTFSTQASSLVSSTNLAIRSAFSLLALFGAAIVVDPLASLIVICVLTGLAAILRPIRIAIRRQAKSTADAGMRFATSVTEISQLGLETQVFGVTNTTQASVKELVRDHQRTQRRLRFLQNLVPQLYANLAYIGVIVALGAASAVETAELESVGAVMLIMLRSLGYGQALQSSSAKVAGAVPFISQLSQQLATLDTHRRPSGDQSVTSLYPVEAKGVCFRYGPDTPVLENVSFQLERNTMVGIIGPSGSGKSTFVQILLGLRSATGGKLTFAGLSPEAYTLDSWTSAVTFVPQQARLLDDTVAANIRFMRDHVSQGQIERAAKLAHVHEDILGWEDGYDRPVGPGGSNLSGGQQQRLVIARALVERPQLLILDEPTSALDTKSEALIRRTLEELRHEMTIVIIAHRMSTLETCDRIMVIQDGELKGFDTPERLAETSPFYREALELSGLR